MVNQQGLTTQIPTRMHIIKIVKVRELRFFFKCGDLQQAWF